MFSSSLTSLNRSFLIRRSDWAAISPVNTTCRVHNARWLILSRLLSDLAAMDVLILRVGLLKITRVWLVSVALRWSWQILILLMLLHTDFRRDHSAWRALDVIFEVILWAVNILLFSHIRSMAHAHISSAHHLTDLTHRPYLVDGWAIFMERIGWMVWTHWGTWFRRLSAVAISGLRMRSVMVRIVHVTLLGLFLLL